MRLGSSEDRKELYDLGENRVDKELGVGLLASTDGEIYVEAEIGDGMTRQGLEPDIPDGLDVVPRFVAEWLELPRALLLLLPRLLL